MVVVGVLVVVVDVVTVDVTVLVLVTETGISSQYSCNSSTAGLPAGGGARGLPVAVSVSVVESVSVTCTSVDVDVKVDVVLKVVVLGGGVKAVTGVRVFFIVALLVNVKATEAVGTGFFEVLPKRVVQRPMALVESPKTSCDNSAPKTRSKLKLLMMNGEMGGEWQVLKIISY